MDDVQREADRLYKAHFGKMVASLLYSSRDIDPGTAEDLVQDSFSAALTDWQKNGIPLNPAGWIYKVCRNKALNRIRSNRKLESLSEDNALAAAESRFSDSLLDDLQLKLLFACAHPDLSPKIQIVITLKYVVNLKVEAIAKIFAMTVDGVDKLLVRARQKIKDEKILLEEPNAAMLKTRLPVVHKVLYLIFNEGYKSSWGKELLREELCEEALLMTRDLIKGPIADKETAALYALMLFHSARFKARFAPSGELLDLENQDRSQWNRDLILLGSDYLHQSRDRQVSSYYVEASIAYLHCSAKSFESTPWPLIAKLYAQLLRNNPNPFVELNYAIALFYAGERASAFDILNRLAQHPFLNQYYLLNATLGKFYRQDGDNIRAREFLIRARGQTIHQAEKDLIQKMVQELG